MNLLEKAKDKEPILAFVRDFYKLCTRTVYAKSQWVESFIALLMDIPEQDRNSCVAFLKELTRGLSFTNSYGILEILREVRGPEKMDVINRVLKEKKSDPNGDTYLMVLAISSTPVELRRELTLEKMVSRLEEQEPHSEEDLDRAIFVLDVLRNV